MNEMERRPTERGTQRDKSVERARTTPYRSLLQTPTVLLTGNPAERADVAAVAILGYN